MRAPRGLLLLGLLLAALIVGAALVLQPGSPVAPGPLRAADPDEPGPVLLVPGYGGATGALELLAGELRQAGREAVVVALPGNATGDLRESAAALATAVDEAVRAGAPSVDVVGYSAGGVVARLWAAASPERARRIVTLGSPHHGTEIAALGAAFDPGSCPVACLQLVPGSDLLGALNRDDETPDGPSWVSIWTTQDTVVTPPESARLDGAVNVALQDLCPGLEVSHGQLPTSGVVRALVLQAITTEAAEQPTSCPTS